MDKLFVSCKPYARKADDSGVFAQGTKIETIDGSTTALTLMPGACAMFNDRGELLVDGSGTYLKDVKYVYFMYGVDNSDDTENISPHRIGQPIYRNSIIDIEHEAYCSPVKQITFVGSEQVGAPVGAMNLPSPLVPTGNNSLGYSATIRIKKRNELEDAFDRRERRYEYAIPASIIGLSAQAQRTAIITNLVTLINNDTKGFVTAAAVGAAGSEVGISITANNFGESFHVATNGVLEESDIVTPFTTGVGSEPKSMVVGCGRPYQIRELEIAALSEQGRNTEMKDEDWRTWKEDFKVNMATNYGYNTITLVQRDLPTGIGEVVKGSSHKPNHKIAIEGTLTTPADPTGTWGVTNSNTTESVLDTLLPIVFGAGGLTASTIIEPGDDIP
jgi:hypothetical protein